MTEQDRIIKDISLVKNKSVRVVQEIVYHPLLFARHKMADPDDYRPIRIRYFGVFTGKYMHNKEIFKKLKHIRQILKDHPEVIKIFVDSDTNELFFTTIKEATTYINSVFKSNGKEEFDKIYNSMCNAIGEV